MESQSLHHHQSVKLVAFLFMPSGRNTRQGVPDSSTQRRSLRVRKTTSNRPSQAVPSTGMTESRRGSQSNRQYMFIDQDASPTTSSEAIRVHVMRESHRARRQLRGLMQTTENHGQMTIFTSASSGPNTVRRKMIDRVEGQSSTEGSPQRDTGEDHTQRELQMMKNQEVKTLAQTRLTAILTTTSPAISAASPGLQCLRSLPVNIVDLCDEDRGALHALLALITSVQASVNTLQTAEYESLALETLRARLAESSTADQSDETIITVLLLSRLERSRLNEETAGFHEEALVRIIRQRGGLDVLASSNEDLVNLLRGYDLGQEKGG